MPDDLLTKYKKSKKTLDRTKGLLVKISAITQKLNKIDESLTGLEEEDEMGDILKELDDISP